MAALAAATLSAKAADESTDTVKVVYNGTTAQVTIPQAVSSLVSCTSGTSSHVVLVQTGTSTELVYSLSGTSTDGSLTMTGSYKTTVCLDGLTLTNSSKAAAINIDNGKRIKVKMVEGTTSTLADVAGGTQKGCLVVKGHTEFRGKGTLNVAGKTAHAIKSGEYISTKNCTINVTAAAKDAINCNEYFLMESGVVNITGADDDGIQVDVDTDISMTGETTDHEDENSGNFYMLAGTLTIDNYEGKAIKSGGTISIASGCTTNFDTSDVKTGTGIVLPQATAAAADATYDLTGRRTDGRPTKRGVYVVANGGKVVKRLF